MTGIPQETAQPHTAFLRLRQAIDAVAANPQTWPRYGSRARRYVFARYPFSLVYIVRDKVLRSSPWRTVDGGPDTGGRDSEMPSNKPLERPGGSAHAGVTPASAGRSAASR